MVYIPKITALFHIQSAHWFGHNLKKESQKLAVGWFPAWVPLVEEQEMEEWGPYTFCKKTYCYTNFDSFCTIDSLFCKDWLSTCVIILKRPRQTDYHSILKFEQLINMIYTILKYYKIHMSEFNTILFIFLHKKVLFEAVFNILYPTILHSY